MRNHHFLAGFRSLLAIAALTLGSMAHAIVVQDFESGIGPNGFVFGDAQRLPGAFFGVAAFAGSGQLVLTTLDAAEGGGYSGFNALTAASLNSSLGLPVGTVQGAAPAGQTAIQGAGYSFALPMSLNVGDIVRFSYDFLTNDNSHHDYAFAVLLNIAMQTTTSILLADALVSPLPGDGGIFNAGTGYLTSAGFTVADAGNYEISFGVIDAANNLIASALLIDSITVVSAVPEPTALALVGLGLAGLGFGRRKRA